MTKIEVCISLSPVDLRLLDKLREKTEARNSEVVTRALRLMAFNVGLMDHVPGVTTVTGYLGPDWTSDWEEEK